MWLDWFWITWYSLLGLVVVLFWYVEFAEVKSHKRDKKKSIWRESRERIHRQQYRSTYGSRRNYSKGM